MQHPAVLEAAVIGTEDADGLTKTKAFVVLKAGRSGRARTSCKAFVKERLAPYKYPRSIEFVDELPKTATGKIQRFRLRERERAGASTHERATPRDAALVARLDWRGRRAAASSTSGSAPTRAARAARRLPARGPGLGRDVAGLPARVLRRARLPRLRLLALRLRPLDAARRRRALGARLHAPPGARGAARAASRALGIERPVALRPQRRRLDRAAACRALPAASPASSRSRRTSSSRTCRSRASSRRATPIRRPTCAQRLGALPRRPRLGLLRLERHLARARRSAHWNIEAELDADPLPGARGAGRGRRVRHARADPRASRARLPQTALARARRLRPFAASRPARSVSIARGRPTSSTRTSAH